jgi:hypothetical protein
MAGPSFAQPRRDKLISTTAPLPHRASHPDGPPAPYPEREAAFLSVTPGRRLPAASGACGRMKPMLSCLHVVAREADARVSRSQRAESPNKGSSAGNQWIRRIGESTRL